jgi:hypothetical protein
MALKFKAGVKRVDRVNARVAYINDDMTPPERALWLEQFDGVGWAPHFLFNIFQYFATFFMHYCLFAFAFAFWVTGFTRP